jgi:transposase-like protein
MSQKKYPEEFKIEAVRQVVEKGQPVAEVSARLGVSQHSLYKWIKWAAAGFKDTLLRWKVKPESGYGNKTAIQPGVQA